MMAAPDRPPRKLYAAALVTLLVVSLAVRLVTFRRVAQWATRPGSKQNDRALEAYHLRRVIEVWCRRLPWRTLCLEQGITAARLLSRSGAPVTLYYGAAMIDGELKAHVWVRSGDINMLGCENASDFAILSQISNDSSSSAVQP